MTSPSNEHIVVWKEQTRTWLVLGLALVMLGIVYYRGFDFLFYMWFNKEEYSHAVLIPFISAFLIWQRKDVLERIPFPGSWTGLAIILLGIGIFMLGQLSAIAVIINYSLLVVIAGLALAYMGWPGFRIILAPLLILVFMIPLPGFLFETFSNQMQLISSQIGVWFIRLFGISVYLEGNVIDLGIYKLQVVEACSGLRYLFPLMTLGFIAAYFFKVEFWKRAVVFLSSIPVTILMNSFRIGAIGVLVEYGGISMAEGFLHDFEGWVVFMACTGVLVVEMWLLSRIGKGARPLRAVFGLEFPASTPVHAEARYRTVSRPFLGVVILLVVVALSNMLLPQRTEIVPPRDVLVDFPMQLGDWSGKRDSLEKIYIDALNFDDYVMANYTNSANNWINLYIAYYASQRSDKVPHSPRACIPGGGWQITDITQHTIEGVNIGIVPLSVNRVVIQKGDHRQLVYYWFQQRGRVIASEYLVKWYIFWDSLTRQRTDGALVRLTVLVRPGQSLDEADKYLSSYARETGSHFGAYIPD